MAAELVGGAFLSASLQVLFDRLASQELVDFVNGKRPFDRLLKDLKIKLLSANMVLNDAEEKQIRNPSVKKWLDELKDAIFEAEDLTAEIKFQALECKMGGGSFSRSGTSQLEPTKPRKRWRLTEPEDRQSCCWSASVLLQKCYSNATAKLQQ